MTAYALPERLVGAELSIRDSCLVVWWFVGLVVVVVVVVRLDLYKEFDVLRNLASMFLLNQSYFNSYSENHQTR
jgi:hypothetical protein